MNGPEVNMLLVRSMYLQFFLHCKYTLRTCTSTMVYFLRDHGELFLARVTKLVDKKYTGIRDNSTLSENWEKLGKTVETER